MDIKGNVERTIVAVSILFLKKFSIPITILASVYFLGFDAIVPVINQILLRPPPKIRRNR